MQNLVRAVFLTEAGPGIGLGHLGRCVALYDALESRGCSCTLVVTGEAPEYVVGGRTARVSEWRSREAARESVQGADIAVIDSYTAELSVYESIAGVVSVGVYLDDTARLEYPPGIVVNGNPEAETFSYGDVPGLRRLLGVRFQLLRSEFGEAPPHPVRPGVSRVMVTVGGSGVDAVRRDLAEAAQAAFPGAELDVVDRPRTARAMNQAMAAADIAVSAAGQTLYELAATGTPTVAVCVAGNQVGQARAFERAGAVLLAGVWGESGTSERLLSLLDETASDVERAAMSRAAQALVDGGGPDRVARECIGARLAARIVLRSAVASDENALLGLRNSPDIRECSLNPATIPREAHHAWFQSRLADPSTVLVMACDDRELAGYVRFDLDDETATVSIALAAQYRGVGLGGAVLEGAIDRLIHEHDRITTLIAVVRSENRGSRAMFARADFSPRGQLPDRVVFERKLNR